MEKLLLYLYSSLLLCKLMIDLVHVFNTEWSTHFIFTVHTFTGNIMST